MTEPTPDISVVVPVFEEEESLPELARQVRDACEAADLDFEVWFVDDGSRDASWTVIQDLHTWDARYAGVRFRRNYGKSAALAAGFERVRGRYVVTMDADLQDDPAEIPGLVETLEEGYDLVSGWKQERKDPISKTVPSRLFNLVTRIVSGIPLHDFNCGFKIYRREVVEAIHVYGEMHRYIPLLAKWEGYDRIGEKPVHHRPRQYGRTKFGVERFVRGFLDLISVAFLTRFAARPLHFFGGLGTLAFLAGFVISLWLSIEKIFYNRYLGDRPLLLLGMLLILLGAQLFSTGLLGDMFIRQRMEDKPGYDVTETVAPSLREVA
ncbi:MAG: glycosyltransferase [Bacteroidetes bacterium]|jgi:glycosyltransferase involved in cell wall biosynthesis|nr:glycosyltransferase [Bacteroidota bacterium]